MNLSLIETLKEGSAPTADQAERERAAQALNGYVVRTQADNSITRRRLNRHQMMMVTKSDNPELTLSSNLFREAFVFNAFNQEGPNLKGLANFTGMSKGEVQRHLYNIQLKIRAAQMQAASEQAGAQIEQAIRDYQPGETNATDETRDAVTETAERSSVDSGSEQAETAVVEDNGAAVSD